MKKLESVFSNNLINKNRSFLLIALLMLFGILIISTSSVSAAYNNYTDIQVDTVDNVVPYLTFNVTGRLYDYKTNGSLSGKNITVNITNSSGASYVNSTTTNATGHFTVGFVVNSSGVHNARVSFAGDVNCSPTTINMAIDAKRVATFFNITGWDNTNTIISGRLLDEYGNPLGNTQFTMTVYDRRGNFQGNRTVTTLNNGSFSTPGGFLDSSWTASNQPANVTLSYLGNQTYTPTSFLFGYTSNIVHLISINPSKNFTANNQFTINGTVVTYSISGSTPTILIPNNINISVYVNGAFYQNVPIINGNFSANFSLPYGYHTITFIYVNNTPQTNMVISNSTINILVSKVPTYIEFDHPVKISTGKNNTISGTLYDSYTGLGIGGKTVSIYSNGVLIGTATTNSAGKFSLTNYVPSFEGDYNITVSFAQDPSGVLSSSTDPYYYYFNKTITVGVELLGSIVTVSNSTVNVTQTFTINGTVTRDDDAKTIITTGVVHIEILLNGTSIKNYTNVPINANGRYNITDAFLESGNYTVRVTYGGVPNTIGGSTATGWLNVLAYTSNTTVSSNTTRTTEPVTITGTVRGSNGALINDTITVTIRNSGGTIIYTNNSVTVTNGTYTIPNIIINITGTYTVTATYAGNNTYNTSNGTGTLTVNIMPTTTTTSSNTTRTTEPVTINGTVIAQNGDRINDTITVTIRNSAGTTIYTNNSVTVTNGTYTIPNIIINTIGTYTVTATYAGNNTYNTSNGTGTITVNPMPTNTTVDYAASKPGIAFNITGKVLGTNGAQINGTVNLTIQNSMGVTVATYNNVAVVNGSFIQNAVLANVDNYTVTATYGGDNTYLGSNGVNDITIGVIDTVITVNSPTTYTTQSFNITGRLTELDSGKGIGSALINIKIGSYTFTTTTNASGYYSYSNTINIAGTYTVDVVYIGTGAFDDTNNSGSLTIIKTPTSINFNNTTEFIYGRNATFEGVLMDTLNNRPIAGAQVVLQVNGVTIATLTTGADGRFSRVIFADPSFANFDIQVIYLGNDTYLDSNNTGLGRNIFNPRELGTYIVVQNVTTKPFQTVRVTITLFNEFGERMSGKNLNITYDGNSYILLTDGSGNVYINYTTSEAGNVPITAVFEGDPVLRVAGSSSNGYILIEMLGTQVLLKNLIVYVYQNATIEGTLVNEYGKILANEVIDIFFEGEYYGTYITDSFGKISIPFGSLPVGKYSIVAHFAGDLISPLIHSGSDTLGTLDVRPIKTHIIASVIQDNNVSTTFVARLFDEFLKPLADKPVLFFLNGDFIGVAVTDANGKAMLPYAFTPRGTLMVEFLEDNYYFGSLNRTIFAPGQIVDKLKKNETNKSRPDKNGTNGNDSNGTDRNNNKVPAVSMLKTGNPIAILALLMLCIFMIGIRRKQKN